MPAAKIHIHRHGCYGYIIAVLPHIPGSAWNLFNGANEKQASFYGSAALVKRQAKKHIDDHPDDFKEAKQ